MAKHSCFIFLSGVLLLPLFLSLACPGAVYAAYATPPPDESGEALPLVSTEAAEIVAAADPMWCPVIAGVPTLPGGAGCSPNFGTPQALIDNMDVTDPQTPGLGLYEQPGIIYFTADLTDPGNSFILIRGGLDDDVASPELYDADYDALKGYDLILQGGWSGVNGDTNFTQSNFGANPVQIGTFTNPWVGSVTINNITIDGASTTGLTVYTNGDINIANVTANNNTLNGAYLDNCLDTGAGCTGSGSVNISSSTFSTNTLGGLEVQTGGSAALSGVNANGNQGLDEGGALLGSIGIVQVNDSNFNGNVGCGLEVGSDIGITLSNVNANGNFGDEGAFLDSFGPVEISNSSFNENSADGLIVFWDTITLSSVTANSNGGGGAALFNMFGTGGILASNSNFDGNTYDGLSILSIGNVTLDAVSTSNNSAGVGTSILALSLVIQNGTFSGNGLDGGVFDSEGGSVVSSKFENNGGPGLGGGVVNFGTLTVESSTISGNTVTDATVSDGGGIYNESGTGTLTVMNSTISGNTATNGGGIYNESGTVAVMNSTISGNSATNGGGVYNLSGTVTVTNSIIAASTGGNCGGAFTDGGHNIDDGATCGFGALSMSNMNPLLDPAGLQNNGGPTRTIALLPGSPAINAAAGCPATDQRGIARPQDSACDIGAYEFVFTPTTTTVSSSLNPSIYGSAVTFTAAVSGSGGTPTGTVTFKDGGATLGSGTLSGGAATFSTSILSGGSHSITAEYGGDAIFQASVSAPLTQSVSLATTTTLIISDAPDPSAVGQAVPVSYTVTAVAPGGGTPTGNVTVSDGVSSCTGTVAAGSCSVVLTTAGARTLTATYAGDGNFNGSSGTASHVVLSQNLLSIAKAGTGTGTVTGDVIGIEGNGINCGPDCAETYNEGTVVTLTATPTNGSAFGGWSGDADCTDGQVTVNAAMTCTASFDLVTTVTIPAATGNGMITLTTGSPGCGFYNVSAKTEAQVGSSDPSYDYPYGLVEFSLSCAAADVTITFPGNITDTTYRKHGPTTPGDPSTTQWYSFSNATLISSTSFMMHFTNGQTGDDTGVEDQVIVDQGGPGEPAQATPVPTMTEWGMMILAVLLGTGSVYYLRRRRSAI